jgi:enoyl-CoA hydratase/carnithine racemase
MMPKAVICVVPGWAAGGGHSLHVVCDLTIASRQHARFKQTDLDVASFDGGFGSAYLAKQVGQKFAREIFFLGDVYSAEDAHRMGMVNAVVDHAELEATALVGGTDHRQVADGAEDAEVRAEPDRRRAGRPAGLRRRGHPPGLHDRRGGGGTGQLPREARSRLVAFPYHY